MYPHGMVPPRRCPNCHIRPSVLQLVDHRFTVARVEIHPWSRKRLGNLINIVSIRKLGTFWQLMHLVCARRCTRLVICQSDGKSVIHYGEF